MPPVKTADAATKAYVDAHAGVGGSPFWKLVALGGGVEGKIVSSGDDLFTLGGSVTGTVVSTVSRLDTATSAWVNVAPMPAPRRSFSTVANAGYVYVLGGYDGSAYTATVFRYSVSLNSWDTLAPLPAPRGNTGHAVLNDRIYLLGGDSPSGVTNTIFSYDISANTWVTKGAVLGGIGARKVCGAIGGFIYGLGGYSYPNNIKYDPVADSITVLPSTINSYGADGYASGLQMYYTGAQSGADIGKGFIMDFDGSVFAVETDPAFPNYASLALCGGLLYRYSSGRLYSRSPVI